MSGVSEPEDVVLDPGERLLFVSLCFSRNTPVTFSRLCVRFKAASFFISERMCEVRGSFLLFLTSATGVRTSVLVTTC